MLKCLRQMKKELLFALSFVGTVGIATALPIVVFGLLGRYLDRHFDTSPKIFIVCVALALVTTYFILRKLVRDATKIKFK